MNFFLRIENLESLEFSLNEEKKKSKSLNLELQELKASYQEVLNRCNDLEKDLEEKQQKNEELSNEFKQLSDSKEKLEEAFQEKEAFFSRNQENFERASIENNFLSKSLEEKDLLMKNQYKELEKLQKSNVLLMEKAEKLQNDLFVSQKNFSDFENSSKENLRMMKQNLEMITTENKNLNIRLTQQQKDNMEKYEEEKKTTSNLKKELYVFELKLSEKEEKIQGLEKLLEKNEEIIKEIDNKYKNVSHALSKSEVILSNKENEKNKVLNQMKTMKKKFMNILREKFGDLKGNMRRLKMNCETVIEEYQGLMNQQISYLPNQIFIYKRQQITLMEDEIEKLKCDMKMRFNRDISSLQEKKENSENEIKRKYESQFEDWNRKSMELTRKMEEIQNNSKKMQGELYSLLKEKETYVKEIELLKGELEKSMSFNQKISKDKAELQSHQDNIVNERVAEIQLKTAKKEKKYLKAMKSLKKEVEILQDRNIKYLNEINEGIETLKLRFEAESRAISKASNEKISNLKEKLSDYESLISDFRGKSSNYELIISDLERNINEVNEDKDQIISRYENHIFMMTRTLDELSSNLRQEKDKHMKELMDKNLEIDILKNKSNRLEGETKRKEEELYSIKSEKNKINHQYEEALIKYNLKNSQCEKEVFEQVQEKKKYEEEVESLQNLLTKKYHKINQIRKNDEGVSINLNEKVRKLHDLEEELKYSLRTKTVVSPERTKISTPLIRNKNATNKQYYSTLTTKKNLTTEGKK